MADRSLLHVLTLTALGCFSTAFLAILFFFVLPDFPEDSTWLSPNERQFILQRLNEERNDADTESSQLSPGQALRVILRPKTLLAGLIYLILTIAAFAYQFFAPTILYTYTSGAIHTQLLSVPPWACGFVASFALAALSDKLRHRFVFATIPQLLAITGYSILLSVHENSAARYAAIYLMVLGLWVPYPIIVCWIAMNVFDTKERGVVLGYVIGFGNIAGIPAVYLFLEKDAPYYMPGFAASLAFVACCSLLNCVYAAMCYMENRGILNEKQGEPGVLEKKEAGQGMVAAKGKYHTSLNMI